MHRQRGLSRRTGSSHPLVWACNERLFQRGSVWGCLAWPAEPLRPSVSEVPWSMVFRGGSLLLLHHTSVTSLAAWPCPWETPSVPGPFSVLLCRS